MRRSEFNRRQRRKQRKTLHSDVLRFLSFLLLKSSRPVFYLFLLSPVLWPLTSVAVQQAWVGKCNLGPASTNHAIAISIDFNGDIIVAGHGVSGATGYDYILLKYSPVGTQVWARTYTSPGNFDDQIRGMKVDGFGNIFITGTSETIMYSGNGTLMWNQPYAGRALAVDNEHVYVTGFSNTIFATAKLSKLDGSNVWLRTFNQLGGNLGLFSEAIALDQNTNVFIAGANICYWHPRGPQYVKEYTIGYTSSGGDVWKREEQDCNQAGNIMTKAIAADSTRNIYVLMNGNGFRCFTYGIFRYTPSGDLSWTYSFEGLCYDGAKGMVLAPNDILYLTGTSIGDSPTRQFGTIKLDANTGTNIWHRQYAGQGRHEANGLGLDAAGNIYVTGKSAYPTVNTPNDFATIKYDPDGNLKWAKRFDGPANSNDEATAIAVTPNGDVYVTGFSTTSSNLVEITTIKYIQVSPIEKKSNGNILLTFCGTPGSNYVIEACSTLTNWTNIGSATANSSGVYTFEDTNAPLYRQRFYRTVTE